MDFLARMGIIETEEQERARLAHAPTGSKSRFLSTLPITIAEWPTGLLIRLPWDSARSEQTYSIVVVPIE
ncbi:hypothetical protein [Amycolatopsis sp. CA-230715]|uniref:hypothetical protein n=1 Tax=Amycolatopsis sp. CA-230715 TaxID=2745196 RepID=UPI001C0278F1|nr:hypothetical protein [Amycolatopsis sp. CA-230715]QWF85745.1 hypothetical protein HUW46_09225 [Amycolatopsis sp. CA-230715]